MSGVIGGCFEGPPSHVLTKSKPTIAEGEEQALLDSSSTCSQGECCIHSLHQDPTREDVCSVEVASRPTVIGELVVTMDLRPFGGTN